MLCDVAIRMTFRWTEMNVGQKFRIHNSTDSSHTWIKQRKWMHWELCDAVKWVATGNSTYLQNMMKIEFIFNWNECNRAACQNGRTSAPNESMNKLNQTYCSDSNGTLHFVVSLRSTHSTQLTAHTTHCMRRILWYDECDILSAFIIRMRVRALFFFYFSSKSYLFASDYTIFVRRLDSATR